MSDPKVPFSTQLPPALRAQVNATIRGVRRATGEQTTLSEFTAAALAAHIEHLQQAHNDGQPWPPEEQGLTRGRRLG